MTKGDDVPMLSVTVNTKNQITDPGFAGVYPERSRRDAENRITTGALRQSESGNDHFWFRDLSSRLGRWTTPDPIAGSLADPQSLNRYSYTRNDPVNLVDPLGLLMKCVLSLHEEFRLYWPDDPHGVPVYSASYFCFNVVDLWEFLRERTERVLRDRRRGPGGDSPDSASNTCSKPGLLSGFGPGVQASAGAGGLMGEGFVQSTTAGGGAFADREGSSVGGFASTGGTNPFEQTRTDERVYGAFIGFSGGGFFTNAHSPQQMERTTRTYAVDIGVGPGFSFEVSHGNGVYVVSYGVGPGFGFAVSIINTTTIGTAAGCQDVQ